jgi:polar amino acid transport system substrate-binding protein
MKNKMNRAALGLVGVVALALTITACGAQKTTDSTTAATAASPSGSSSVDAALAAMVPAAIKADGTISVGSDSTYAPSEFLDTDGKTIIGFDVDLFDAVAAKLGLKTTWTSADFGTLVAAVQSGKYEIGVSSFTINKEREAQSLMISYFSAGTQWAGPKGSTIDPNNACGKHIAVQANTVQVADIATKSSACTRSGKAKITVDPYTKQGDATAAVVSGKDAAMLADSPVSAYAVKTAPGLQLLGSVYDSAPYGYVVGKDQTDFANAIKGAVADVIKDGTYNQILTKWNVQAGAITNPTVNPAV